MMALLGATYSAGKERGTDSGATLFVSMMPFAPSMARASEATRRAAATLWRLCRLTWGPAWGLLVPAAHGCRTLRCA